MFKVKDNCWRWPQTNGNNVRKWRKTCRLGRWPTQRWEIFLEEYFTTSFFASIHPTTLRHWKYLLFDSALFAIEFIHTDVWKMRYLSKLSHPKVIFRKWGGWHACVVALLSLPLYTQAVNCLVTYRLNTLKLASSKSTDFTATLEMKQNCALPENLTNCRWKVTARCKCLAHTKDFLFLFQA